MDLLLNIMIVFFSFREVSGLNLSVQTSYIEIGGSSVTFECNIESAAWNPSSARQWKVPPNTMTVINGGTANTGYTEDLSDVATTGIFRMTTTSIDWSIENQLFQCVYSFDIASLNATRSTLARNSGSSVTYDDSAKKCIFSIDEILPSPSKVITLVQASGQLDISTDLSKVTETLTNNNDQGQTYSYGLEVASKDLNDGDQVIFQVTAGPYSMNETCTVTESKGLSPGVIAAIVICVLVVVAGIVVAVCLGVKKKYPCQKGSPKKKPDSGNSGTPRTESGNATNQGNETKDTFPKTDDRVRHQELQHLTNASVDGTTDLNPNPKLPGITSNKS